MRSTQVSGWKGIYLNPLFCEKEGLIVDRQAMRVSLTCCNKLVFSRMISTRVVCLCAIVWICVHLLYAKCSTNTLPLFCQRKRNLFYYFIKANYSFFSETPKTSFSDTYGQTWKKRGKRLYQQLPDVSKTIKMLLGFLQDRSQFRGLSNKIEYELFFYPGALCGV